MLQNPYKLENMTSELLQVREKLGSAGASHRTAEIALNLLQDPEADKSQEEKFLF
jgi:hypothetical protein